MLSRETQRKKYYWLIKHNKNFAGIRQDIETPGFSSLWLIRESLAKHDLDNKLFNTINAGLAKKGLFVKKGTAEGPTILHNAPVA